MELVGAATGDDVDDGAGVASEFGIESVGDDAELLGGVGIGGGKAAGDAGDGGVVVVGTVKQEVVVAVALAVAVAVSVEVAVGMVVAVLV